MKKWIISLLVIIILCGIRFVDPWFLDMVRLKALDQHQRNQEVQSLTNLVTVEINNETIKEKGQWPWDRNTLSNEIIRLIKSIHNYKVPEIIKHSITIENKEYEEWAINNIKK
mgnify:CR=1 FL=1